MPCGTSLSHSIFSMSIRHQKDILFTALAGLVSASLACIVLYDHFGNQRLIGNLDIWFYHWQAEDFRLWFSQEILHHSDALYHGQIAYPVDNPSGYAGSSWALGIPYLLGYSLFPKPIPCTSCCYCVDYRHECCRCLWAITKPSYRPPGGALYWLLLVLIPIYVGEH